MKESDSGFFTKAELEFTDSFEVESKLHTSSTGHTEVYAARRALKRFALKALKPELRNNPFYIGLLRKEFEIGYRLEHPGIVRTYSFEQVEGLGPCIVSEWIDGDTLVEAISRRPLKVREWARIVSELCDAIGYLESRQIVHHDLKPGNVMLTADGSHAKLIDFGFADSPEYAALKDLGGTPEYAAPEQLEEGGEAVTHLSDIYALGKLLQELPLPDSKRVKSLIDRMQAENPTDRPRDITEVKDGVLKALQPDRRKRITVAVALFLLLCGVTAALLLFFLPAETSIEEESDKSVPSALTTDILTDTLTYSETADVGTTETPPTLAKEEATDADFKKAFPEEEDLRLDKLAGSYSGSGYIYSSDYPIEMEMEIRDTGFILARYKNPGDFLWTRMKGKVKDSLIVLEVIPDPEADFEMRMRLDYRIEDYRLDLSGYAVGADGDDARSRVEIRLIKLYE